MPTKHVRRRLMFDQDGVTKRLFLARHGESLANRQKIISGQLDTPLTEKGRKQAEWLCDVLKSEKLSVIYSSSLDRAIQTALPTARQHRLSIKKLDGLKEIHFGVLQGKSSIEEKKGARALLKIEPSDGKNLAILGGETFTDFEERITSCLDSVLDSFIGTALIVAHRNTNEVILSRLLACHSIVDLPINVKNKYLYEIELGRIPTINTIRLGGMFHGMKFSGFKDD